MNSFREKFISDPALSQYLGQKMKKANSLSSFTKRNLISQPSGSSLSIINNHLVLPSVSSITALFKEIEKQNYPTTRDESTSDMEDTSNQVTKRCRTDNSILEQRGPSHHYFSNLKNSFEIPLLNDSLSQESSAPASMFKRKKKKTTVFGENNKFDEDLTSFIPKETKTFLENNRKMKIEKDTKSPVNQSVDERIRYTLTFRNSILQEKPFHFNSHKETDFMSRQSSIAEKSSEITPPSPLNIPLSYLVKRNGQGSQQKKERQKLGFLQKISSTSLNEISSTSIQAISSEQMKQEERVLKQQSLIADQQLKLSPEKLKRKVTLEILSRRQQDCKEVLNENHKRFYQYAMKVKQSQLSSEEGNNNEYRGILVFQKNCSQSMKFLHHLDYIDPNTGQQVRMQGRSSIEQPVLSEDDMQ